MPSLLSSTEWTASLSPITAAMRTRVREEPSNLCLRLWRELRGRFPFSSIAVSGGAALGVRLHLAFGVSASGRKRTLTIRAITPPSPAPQNWRSARPATTFDTASSTRCGFQQDTTIHAHASDQIGSLAGFRVRRPQQNLAAEEAQQRNPVGLNRNSHELCTLSHRLICLLSESLRRTIRRDEKMLGRSIQ